jgi:hypothetical protein
MLSFVWSQQRKSTVTFGQSMGKRKLAGQKLGRVFNSRLCHACIGHAIVHNKTA